MRKKLFMIAFVVSVLSAYAETTVDLGSSRISSGGYYQSKMKENNGKVVITEEEIQKKDYPSVVSIFEDSPVTVVHHTPFGPTVDLRGSGEKSISRVKVMMDGVSLNPLEEAMGTIPFDAIPIDSIQEVQITPGTGTTLYGGGTTGGTVNIITKSKQQSDYATVNAGTSSYSTFNVGGAGGVNIGDNLFVNVAEYYRHGDDYREEDKTERTNFIGGFDWKMTPKQRLRLQTNLYRDNIDGSTGLKHKELEKDRRAAGEKTRSEIDRRGYSLDYILTPTNNFKWKVNVNGSEFDRDAYQHGKQDTIILNSRNHSDFYAGNARAALKDIESDLHGKFDEKVRNVKTEAEWKYNNQKSRLVFGYEYKKHELKRTAEMEQKQFAFLDMGVIPTTSDGYESLKTLKNQFVPLIDYLAYTDAKFMHTPIDQIDPVEFDEVKNKWESYLKDGVGDSKVGNLMHFGTDLDKKTHSMYILDEHQWNEKLRFKTGLRWEHSVYGGKRYNQAKVNFSDLSPALLWGLGWYFDFTSEEEAGITQGKITSITRDASYKDMETNKTSDDIGGEIGFTYEYSPKGSVYLRYERGFVTPSPSQLTNKDFMTGVYYPSDVKSEKVDTIEIGTKRFLGNNSFVGATVFASVTHDEITLIDYNGNNPMNRRWAYTNLAETNRYGIELQAQHWFDKLRLRESFTYISAKVGKDSKFNDFIHSAHSQLAIDGDDEISIPFKKGDKVPMVSDIKITLGADYYWTDKFSLGANYTYVSGYEMKSPGENFALETYKVKGHGTLDIYGKYNFTDYASVRFGVNNVLGTEYNLREDAKFAVPASKQTYFVGLQYRF